jgi:hypothetical protein
MASRVTLSPWERDSSAAAPRGPRGVDSARAGGGAGGNAAQASAAERPRVVLQFPSNASDILLSGTLQNGQGLAGRAQVVDSKLGDGHVVSFAIRPFWRWQTQGTFNLGFNTIMNWNDLDAGRSADGRPNANTQAGTAGERQ